MFSSVLIILNLGEVILGSITLRHIKYPRYVPIIDVIFGGVGMVLSILGFLGGRYSIEGKPKHPFMLIIFYIFLIVFCVVSVIVATLGFCGPSFLEALLLQSPDDLRKYLDSTKGWDNKMLYEFIEGGKKYMVAIGVMCLFAACVTLLTILTASIHMGKKMFQRVWKLYMIHLLHLYLSFFFHCFFFHSCFFIFLFLD